MALSVAAQALATRAAALVSEDLAARGLLRLFLAPRRFRVPAREEAWVGVAEEHWVHGAGRPLRLWSWGEGPPVLLVHGWEGRGSQMGAFAAPLVAAGFRAVAYDAPGHGASGGERSSIPEMTWALADVARLLGGVHAIVAHSAGSVAVTTALGQGLLDGPGDGDDSAPGAAVDGESDPKPPVPRVGRLVYLAPPDDPGRFLADVGRMLRLPAGVADHARRRIEERFGMRFDAFRGSETAPGLDVPLLAFHDPEDREVPYAEVRRLVERWPGARLVTPEGLGHRRILRDPEVLRQAVDFLAG